MSKSRSTPKRRRKYCPVCKEEVAMSVIREAEDEADLWWLLCPGCNGKYAFTNAEYRREKRPDIPVIEKSNAREYHTDQTYSVGELIYHPKLDDVGMVTGKTSPPIGNQHEKVMPVARGKSDRRKCQTRIWHLHKRGRKRRNLPKSWGTAIDELLAMQERGEIK